MGDDFSNLNLKAREKGLHWLGGNLFHLFNKQVFLGQRIKIFFYQVMETREEEFSDRLNNRATFSGCTALHYACIIDDAGKKKKKRIMSCTFTL